MFNSRFAVAIHILTFLAIEDNEKLATSEDLACSADTHPVVIRRLLVSLGRASLVTAQPGPGGGVSLARRPEDITLQDVFCAVGETELFSLGSRRPTQDCICGRNIQPVLSSVFLKADQAVYATLAGMTIATIAAEVIARDKTQLPPEIP